MSSTVTFTFDGQTITVEEGASIASALFERNIKILRKTRMEDQPRSIFCGIGICFDCVVVVDGRSNQRACITLVRDGMEVKSAL